MSTTVPLPAESWEEEFRLFVCFTLLPSSAKGPAKLIKQNSYDHSSCIRGGIGLLVGDYKVG